MPTLPQLPPFSLLGLFCTNLLCPIFCVPRAGFYRGIWCVVCDSWKRALSLSLCENAICPNSATRLSVLRQRARPFSPGLGHSLAPLCRTIPSSNPSALIFLLSLSVPSRRNHLYFYFILFLSCVFHLLLYLPCIRKGF